ncbi:MAG: hypothetical protein ABI837_03665, partial [Acidobacteriota bacterium]
VVTSLQFSISASHAFLLKALTHAVTSPKEHHTKVSAADFQNLTDLIRGEPLDLPEDKYQTLLGRNAIQAVPDTFAELSSLEFGIGWERWVEPRAVRVEPALHHAVDVVVDVVVLTPLASAARLLQFVKKNAEDPGADM